ncbi:MAG: lamin tail domain-containing protein, partial [Kiritimatiellia bacterium]|nr:lamin tail domain-containing protein [Kiritimatiellia bacterium]
MEAGRVQLRLTCGVYPRVLVVSLCLLISVSQFSGGGLVINEFMAVNDTTLTNAYGETSDWIEIYNSSAGSVDLSGWFLTDNVGDLVKWRFPETNLCVVPPNGYLIVFASDTTNSVVGSELHASFALKGSGEYLALVDTNGTTVVDSYDPEYPEQSSDISYGILADRISLGYFDEPTPGAENTSGYSGIAEDPQFSRESGALTNDLLLTLSTTSLTAQIHYTLDGSLPTDASPEFVDPLNVSGTVQVRAKVYDAGMLPGATVSRFYYRLEASAYDFSSDIPVVVIDTFGEAIPGSGDTNKIFAYMAVLPTGTNSRSALLDVPAISTRMAITVRGSSSAGQPKAPYSFESQDEFGDDKDIEPLGMPAESDWILNTKYTFDRALIRHDLAYELSNQSGRYATRTRFVEMFVVKDGSTVSYPGDYVGVYSFMEKIKRDNDRVDVEKLDPPDTNSYDITGGYITKIDRGDPGDTGFSAGGQGMHYVYPKEAEMKTSHQVQAAWLTSFYNEFDSALDGGSFTDPDIGYAKYIDVDSWIDHHILNTVTMNPDALRLSTYMFKKRGERLEKGPIWDFDRTMESLDSRDDNPEKWESYFFTYSWWNRLFQDPDFWQKWIDRWDMFRQTTISETNILATITAMSNEVTEAQERNFDKWTSAPPRTSSAYVSGELDGTWEGEIRHLYVWLTNRVKWVDSQFLPTPMFSTNAGFVPENYSLEITLPEGVSADIYYTIDGTDPRGFGGSVGATALEYTAPLTISENTIVRARAWDGLAFSGAPNHAPWSAMGEGVFVTVLPTLAVSEVMYHPRDPSAGETNASASGFEFIEIYNDGDEATSLVAVEIAAGVSFNFSRADVRELAAGEHVVVVSDLAVFKDRYPQWSTIAIAGEYDGKLNDAGDDITLIGPTGDVMLDFECNDARGWPVAAYGAGHSLVPVVISDQASGVLKYGGNWRASSYIDGSPGEADPEPVTDIVLNELMAHTDFSDPGMPWLDSDDWVEVYNTSSSAVSLAHWYLSDSADNLKKWPIEPTDALASNAWVTFTESQHFHTNELTGFGLDKDGETLFLSYLPGTDEDRVGDAVRFKGQENDVTLGRYTDGGEYWFTLSPTTNAANAAPSSRVVIAELMIHPPPTPANPEDNTHDEYIKLFNPLDSQVDLWTDSGPWRIDGGVDFVLPADISLAANGSLLIVPFDPSDTNSLTVFADAYGITNAESMTILGPYDGKLSNWGERIALERPQAPDVVGDAPSWVIVDEVIYSTSSPWPTEVHTNTLSLQRTSILESGNDPDSWSAVGANPTVPVAKIAVIDPVAGGTILVPSFLTVVAFVDEGQVDGAVHYVEFFLDDTNSLGIDGTPPYEVVADYYDISTAGDYRLRAEMVDDGGTNESIEIEVHAVWAERIEIAEPNDGDSLLTPFEAALSAAVFPEHVVGTVANVTFYDGTNVLAVDVDAPYSCDISQHNLLPGMVHELTAVMTDEFGPSTSTAVNVYVYDSIYKDWDHRMPVSISGYADAQGVEDFPVLVKLHEGL